MKSALSFCSALAVLAIAASAQAALVATDGFEDATTTADLTTPPGSGSGWAAAWTFTGEGGSAIELVSRSMTYNGGAVSVNGGQQALKFSPGVNVITTPLSRPFASQTGPIYMSFLLHAPTATALDDNQAANDDFFQFGFMNSVTNPTVSGGIQSKGGDTGGNQFLFSRQGTSGGTFAANPVDPEAVYFIVLKASKEGGASDYNNVQLFINPDSAVEGDQAGVLLSSGSSGLTSASDWIFRVARTEAADHYFVDEFRLGTDFASVVPVPEPAALSLLALGGAALRRRRVRDAVVTSA